ncbi:MAG: RNA polymerase factor sigma-54 [Candidatus Omnitrophica bacterium]|nr:RNA polymerase factor sigma-54 [Candidatus Omnitrophota bacterium]
MKLSTVQTTRQLQRLTVTPSVRLALDVLQLPLLDLKAFLEHQIEENPLLEMEEGASTTLTSDSVEDPHSDTPAGDEHEDRFGDLDDNLMEALAANDTPVQRQTEDPRQGRLEAQPMPSPSLHELLRLQLGCLPLGEAERQMGELLIEQCNEDGYLSAPLEEIARQAQIPLGEAERLLQILHTLEPSGVGARTIQECLLIQLRHRGLADSLAAAVVREHWTLFLRHDLKHLAARSGRSLEEMEAACHLIRQLNPKPYRATSAPAERPWVPDLAIRQVEDGYEVELYDEELPRLRVSRTYRQMLHDPRAPVDAKLFVKERLRQAIWLLRAIEQRHTTLLAIARCLIEEQRAFLEQGFAALRPLTQAEVAQRVGRHPSTVGRAIAGKLMATPFGILPMERFFASRVPQAEAHASLSDASIKAAIATCLAEEDPRHPYSDEALTTLLRQQGMAVARRTVAKYRTALKMLPAHLRRRAAVWSGRQRQEPAQVGQASAPAVGAAPLTNPTPTALG